MQRKEVRVLQIFNQYLEYGGEEGSVERIASLLRKRVTVHTYVGSTEDLLKRRGGKLLMPFLMQKNKKVIDELRALHTEMQFDVWQIHNVFPGLSVAVYELAVELGIPVIQYLHNYRFGCANATYFRDGHPCVECRPDNFMPAIRNRCWRGSLPATISMVAALKRFRNAGGVSSIKAFVALSEAQKQAHIRTGFPKELIHVLHHNLDDDGVERTVPPPQGDVLFIGRLTEEKGLRLLVKAWSKVKAEGRKLRIVGKGPMKDELEALVASKQIRDVVFEGFVPKEKHAQLWEQASFFIAPSVWDEPFGMVILEAWRQSRPILATNLGSFPELVSNQVNGWLAEADVEAFAETLQCALNSAEDYDRMGQNGRKTLWQEFNSERWLDGWMAILETAVATSGRTQSKM
jgi:glycosyltransferase involved in cell wall biosynthesis